MTINGEPPVFALEWCRRLGASPDTLEPLRGGINNQVFRCRAGAHWLVLKGYTHRQAEQHDRFRAETEFLRYAELVAPECAPKLLYSDQTNQSIVLEHVEGEKFQEGSSPSPVDINQAVAFIKRLNADLELAREHVSGDAAEGFLRLTEHLQNINQRIEDMGSEHLPILLKEEAEKVIRRLKERYERLEDVTQRLIADGQCDDALDPRARCVSPSDFGFHNAVCTPSGVKLLDFEFAGWDDPAKLVADFDLQPRVPVRPRVKILSDAIPSLTKEFSARHSVLFPILELKWACIILTLLNPIRWAQVPCHTEGVTPEDALRAKLSAQLYHLPKD